MREGEENGMGEKGGKEGKGKNWVEEEGKDR